MSANPVRSDFNMLRPSQEWFGDSGGQPPAALMLSTPGVYGNFDIIFGVLGAG